MYIKLTLYHYCRRYFTKLPIITAILERHKTTIKLGYVKILVKTDCFETAGLEFVHIIVKHVCFDQFTKFSSSLCNRMTVQVQIHRKTLCF